jgi:hypothetical protein
VPRKPLGDVAMTATERQRRWRAGLKQKRQIQSRHTKAERKLDAYFTCPEAVVSLLYLERKYLPCTIWEPAAGDGAIVHLLRRAGCTVTASDIKDYGLPGCLIADYFTLPAPPGIAGIVTNPPYAAARRFAEKALDEAPYVALLLRSNFLIEGSGRDSFLETHPPARIWHSSARLPMMHRHGWTGRRSGSNTPYSWAIWDARANRPELPRRFNWHEIVKLPEEQRQPFFG